jgi:hypothetical protein
MPIRSLPIRFLILLLFVTSGYWITCRASAQEHADLLRVGAVNTPYYTGFLDDPLLQRVMVSVLIKPDRVAGVNYEAAKSFQKYLLSPRAQVLVRDFRVENCDRQLWWPAARHNDPAALVDEDTSWNTSARQTATGTGGGRGAGSGGGGGRGDGSGTGRR